MNHIPGMAGDWKQVAENLVRHANGTYYLRAKVHGKVIRESLRTKDARIARIRRDDRLASLRSAVARSGKHGTVRTMREVLDLLRADLVERPNIRPKTVSACADLIRILKDTLPLDVHARTWTRQEAAAWWSTVGKKYSPSVANKLHGAVRKLAAIMIEHGLRTDDPTRGLKRIPNPRKLRVMPGRAQMDAIIGHILGAGKRGCTQSARMVAWLAFTGMRKGEVAALRWDAVGPEWVTVGAQGDTKGKEFRLVPVSAPLAKLIAEMRADNRGGRVFYMASPRKALHSACRANGVPLMRVHDLRHFFATWCIESGIDIPTVAKWLGHKDGGALAMQTYGHIRDQHSLAAVKKLA
jgi:integrase